MHIIRILIVESDAKVRGTIRTLVARLGLQPVEVADPENAERSLANVLPILVIVGGAMAEDGLSLVRSLRAHHSDLPVLLFPSSSSEGLAIEALRAGVADYIKQPDYEGLTAAITRVVGIIAVPEQTGEPKLPLLGQTIAGPSLALERVRQCIRRVAAVDCTVLITGETGTGKDLVAQAIHCNSSRSARPFVILNCAAIPDDLVESELFGFERGAFTGAHALNHGKLAQADGGTVFLDEIGELSAFAQAKLLRVIENKEVQRLGGKQGRPVNIRIVAATNQNLEHQVAQNRFRQDLYFRLNVAQIRVPPLRERREDIPALIRVFLDELSQRMPGKSPKLSPRVMDLFMRHNWPGNVRELKNLLEGLLVNASGGEWVEERDLPDQFLRPEAGSDERTIVLCALQSARWNKSKAAQSLNWSRMTLYRKMAKYEILRRVRKNQAKAVGADSGRVA